MIEDEEEEEEDLGDIIDDPEFLQSVLRDLPGVDPNSEAIQQVIESTKQRKEEKDKEKK